MGAQDQIATLQRFIDDVPKDARTVHEALSSESNEDARKVLVGALNYMLDLLDIFPDHYKGLGLADDAAVLRVAARLAVEAGASSGELARLAREASEVDRIFADLAEPFAKLVGKMAEREVRGRTTQQILSSKDLRAGFDADVQRAIAKLAPSPIEVGVGGADAAVKDLLRMVLSAVKKAGL